MAWSRARLSDAGRTRACVCGHLDDGMGNAVTPAESWKEHWSDFGDVTYLNFAGHAARPLVVRDAVERALAVALRPDRLDEKEFFEAAATARRGIATLIGAVERDIALTTGASAGLAHCAHAVAGRPGDEVAIVAGDFPSHHATWEPWTARNRLSLRVIRPQRVPTADDIVAELSARTRVLSVSHVRFDDGSMLDVPAVAEACRRHGTLFVLDVSQSCGAVPIDVARLGADVLVCAGYKYLMGPWGAGFLWASPRAREIFEGMPCNWLAQSTTNFRELVYDAPVLRADAGRWDAAESNTPFNFNLAALAASVTFVVRASVARVHAHVRELLATLRETAGARLSWVTPAQEGTFGPFLCLEAGAAADGRRVHEKLKAGGIMTALRNGRVRIAPHLLHTHDDMERVAASLRAALSKA